MNFDNVREQFPAVQEMTFLDAAAVGVAPRGAVESIKKFAEMAMVHPERSSTKHHLLMDEMRQKARPQVARLINADEDEIALVESTTQGLSIAADALPLEKGDRMILCDLEFMQVAVPWYQKQKEAGIAIDVVHNSEGMIHVEDIAEKIGAKTRVVAISSVQWTNGFRCDLEALGSLCRSRGLWLVVDAVQQIGAIAFDVKKTPVDFLACGGHKWLNSPFGTGFLYIRRQVMAELNLPLAGYLSIETPEGGWGNYFQTPSISPVREYHFIDQARRFEIGGTANYPGAIGLAASLGLINELGPSRITKHIYKLTDHLISGCETLKVDVITPRDPDYRSGIVTLSMGSHEKNLALSDYLHEHDVIVSVRYTSNVGGLRVSCHFYNSIHDIDRLLNLIEKYLGRG
jgi:selenocysteine lyase/cysteine desulfurase